jgi:hypothetical protein
MGNPLTRLIENRYSAILAIAIIVLVLPFIVPSTFYLRIATLSFIFALAVLGLNLLMGSPVRSASDMPASSASAPMRSRLGQPISACRPGPHSSPAQRSPH